MLKPRDTDIPVLFLVLVVVPVVAYILLGRWSESSKRKERISLLAQLAAEESFRAQQMTGASVIPPVSPPKATFHECARCRAPATTRCSRCKSVRYCSGKCQIMHWRQIHKDECQPSDSNNKFALGGEPAYGQSLFNEHVNQQFIDGSPKQPLQESFHSDENDSMDGDASKILKAGRRSAEKRASCKAPRELIGRENRTSSTSADDNYGSQDASPPNNIDDQMFYKEGNSLLETIPNGGSIQPKTLYHSDAVKISKSSKSVSKSSVDQSSSGKEKKGLRRDDEPVARMGNISAAPGGNGMTNTGFMCTVGLKKSSKVSKKDESEVHAYSYRKVKMLFPYDEFMKFFQYEILDVTPRGLSNCGNSCYANAVLQCLTCTKPLVVYLLKRTHSRSCCVKRWCLMCELEQHVATLKDSFGPLSPSRILSQMRSMNCPMGDGSQEDAHEFLRLLVASMQSICLEEVGGEKHVHPSLQETTFIQYAFGGRLRSKVECLKCHHRSDRCENIMDLTLEIFGWVESLEDALTQFTAWEDLDGENMYKCGRCTSYVRAKKQLSIDEAPNILTIVLKRFQEGSYGKINKCITFPEMLDMIPFMTGTYDIPPLYMLYAVVVHMDTLNASFSGHYVSYVKDLQGNWLRIDDSEVQPVPMSQVMSEGAYILFYMRSSPRPPHASARHSMSKSSHKSSRPKSSSESLAAIASSMVYNSHTSNDMLRSTNRRFTPLMTNAYPDFSDAASSSDWSLFTSSDDASFTTESTRDSFSTATEHTDMLNPDPVTSFFNTMYPSGHSSQRTVSCRMFSGSEPVRRFLHEEKGFVESYEPHPLAYPLNEAWSSGGDWEHVSLPPGEDYVNYHHDFATYDGSYNDSLSQTPESWCRQ